MLLELSTDTGMHLIYLTDKFRFTYLIENLEHVNCSSTKNEMLCSNIKSKLSFFRFASHH